MTSTPLHMPRRIFLALIFFLLTAATSAEAAANRNALWEIVTTCLNPGVANYCTTCKSPMTGTPCAAGLACQNTTEVWDQTEEFVVLRDRKMCGCPEDFVHGLVIPKRRVTGVEDPLKPNGIWEYAWISALMRIEDQTAAALVVNPGGTRAQDQLHVHIVRLRKDARQDFCQNFQTNITDLSQVWAAAAKIAASNYFYDYGVLVAAAPEGGFTVLVERESPEKKYAIERCVQQEQPYIDLRGKP